MVLRSSIVLIVLGNHNHIIISISINVDFDNTIYNNLFYSC